MPSPRDAYADLFDATSGPAISRVERAALADLLHQLGPDAPTLCAGWTTHHLAAHLVIREGAPWDIARNLARGDATVAALARTADYAGLVERIRGGPPRLSPFRLPRLDPLLNSLEYFVHHEDVRRAQPSWEARTLPSWADDQLWRGIRGFARLALRRSPVGVALERSDTGERLDGRGDRPPVTVRGLPGEITLHLFGRREFAEVEVTGSPAGIAAHDRHRPRI